MHFAHFEKQAKKTGDDRYKVSITYNREDETEMLIRILAFGPLVRVTAPEAFTDLVKGRLMKQRMYSVSNNMEG